MFKSYLLILTFLLIPYHFQSKDKFIGKVVAEWIGDGRTMKLKEDFAYIDPQGKKWLAPKGTIVDGASIPRIFWTAIGGPFEGNYRNASVIHDRYCCKPFSESWQKVHKMFYDACITGGVSVVKAKIMYAAVYAGGPRWKTEAINERPGNKVVYVKFAYDTSVSEEQFKDIEEWINNDNPDIVAIENSLDKIVIEKKSFQIPD